MLNQVKVCLVLFANHTKGSFWVREREVVLGRGQIGWSEITMSERWKWIRNKVRRFLKQIT